MARSRNIKPGTFKNEILGVADPIYTLTFQGTWLLADREGRLEDRPLRIKAETFPYRDGVDMNALLDWLQTNGFILRYQAAGKRFIQIINFRKHQNPHKNEAESEIPPHDEIRSNTELIGAPPDAIGSTRADSLNLIPDSLNPIDAAQHGAATPSRTRGTRLTNHWQLPDDYRQWAIDNGIKPDDIQAIFDRFKDYWIAQPGHKGIKADWFAVWRNWCRREPSIAISKHRSLTDTRAQTIAELTGAMNTKESHHEYDITPESLRLTS